MTDKLFEQYTARVIKGKAWILDQPGGWGSKDPQVKKWIEHWFIWSTLLLQEEAHRRHITAQTIQHSTAWHDMKFREAFEKWSRTYPKATRGPDPRTLPRDSFE